MASTSRCNADALSAARPRHGSPPAARILEPMRLSNERIEKTRTTDIVRFTAQRAGSSCAVRSAHARGGLDSTAEEHVAG
jgi:hypothetical protein